MSRPPAHDRRTDGRRFHARLPERHDLDAAIEQHLRECLSRELRALVRVEDLRLTEA
jgi:hypothetical protein